MTVRAAQPTACASRDREVIRIDHADDRMGIAAALRRAFHQAAQEPSDRDFDELLRRLN